MTNPAVSIGAFVVVALVGAVLLLWHGGVEVPPPSGAVVEEAQPSLPPRDVPQGSKEYQSAAYKFSLLYADFFTVAEYQEGGGATTITFEQVTDDSLQGFQVFVTPSSGGEVTEAFVRAQVPTANSFQQVMVNGASGLAFLSSDGTLGELREVWFARGNFLYQTVAPQPFESILLQVLQTWLFI